MSRPSHVLYPLPSVRCDRKVTRSMHAREAGVTVIAPVLPKVAKAGDLLPRVRYALVFP